MKKGTCCKSVAQQSPRFGFLEFVRDLFLGQEKVFDCVQVEVSSRCLGCCTYCPHTVLREQWQGRDMAMDTFNRLRPLMRRALRVHLQGWGEPFLNPNFFTMAAMAKAAGCRVSTTTCGLAMDPARARAIIESGMDIVAFSLVGTDAGSNAQRLGIDFDKVCHGITVLRETRELAKARYPEIHLAYLLLASNTAAISDLPALMQRLGVDNAVISTLDYLPDPELIRETFVSEDREIINKTTALLQTTAAEADRLGLGFYYEFPYPAPSASGCRENIDRSLFVSADGMVSPCVFVNMPTPRADHNSLAFGKVHDLDPLRIWNSLAYRNFRDRLLAGEPDQPCKNCRKRNRL